MKPDPMQELSEMESINKSKALGCQAKTWNGITWQTMTFLSVSIVLMIRANFAIP